MKELSIEEKAKAYDKALEAIKSLQEVNPSDEGIQNWVNDNFPELKESEDDEIRKWLEEHIEAMSDNSIEFKDVKRIDVLHWLEKQDEIKPSYEIAEKEKQEFVGDGFIKCHANFQDFKEGNTYWLEYIGDDNYSVRSDNLLGKTYHITPCQLYTIFKKQTWLEKQGEQKLPIEKLSSETKTIGESLGFTTQEECDYYNQMVTDLIMSNDDKGELKSAETVEWSPQEENYISELELLVKEKWRKAEKEHNSASIKKMSELLFFLKTLNPNKKSQKQWNPSDEQMKALSLAMCGVGDPLFSLYLDLEKLKG